jgi:hypothetical protein
VSKGSSELHQSRSFDIDITQYGIMPQQVAHMRCFYPDGLRRLQKTTVPDAGKHVSVHGVITEIEGRRCVVCVHDITLQGPLPMVFSMPVVNMTMHRRKNRPISIGMAKCEITVYASLPCIATSSKYRFQTPLKFIAFLISRSPLILEAQAGQ